MAKTKSLVASSPTKEGLTALISQYYMGSTIKIDDQGHIHNAKGKGIRGMREDQKRPLSLWKLRSLKRLRALRE